MAGMIPQEVHVGGMESSATPLQRRITSWRKLHTAAEEEDYFVEETGAEDDDTVEDDEPDHEPCEEVPASCDSVSDSRSQHFFASAPALVLGDVTRLTTLTWRCHSDRFQC